jgi:5-deoxy-glucuronate isomerase
MMLSDTLIRAPRTPGLHLLQSRGRSGARELSSWRLRLAPGERASHRLDDEETVVVLQSGRGSFAAGAMRWLVSRRDVFEERATACYVPPGESFEATAETALEAILISTPAPRGGTPALVSPDDVVVNARGRGAYSRQVHDVFVRDAFVRRLMVGETFNPPGHWSSFPPHKHDGRDGEPTLEEVYYFRINPPQGFGHQMLYAADGELVTHTVRDGDVVLLPYGYHPVSSPPGYDLYYLWAMAGAERKLALFEDPAHRWIHDIP